MTVLIGFFITVLGMFLASFCHVVALRLPQKKTLLGRSMCDDCQHTLGVIDIIPVIGYLVLRGKCRDCQAKINIAHPLIEMLGGALFLFTYLYYDISLTLLITLVVILVMLTEAISDATKTVVIDRVWIIGTILLMILRLLEGTFLDHLLSSLALFALMFLIAYLGKLIAKKEVLGGGDVKLFIFIGWALTLMLGLLALFLASLFALVYAIIKGKRQLPMVPFIMAGVLVAMFAGQFLIDGYLRLLGV